MTISILLYLYMSEIIRIPNIEAYTQEIINGELVLTPKQVYITEEEFNRTILKSSRILECVVKYGDTVISNRLKYIRILENIWQSMPTQKILQTTTFNMKLTNENYLLGYKWYPSLKLSIQSKDARSTMNEIVNMVKQNGYSMNITIQLETNQIIKFKLNM
jgi:hypothetical protein